MTALHDTLAPMASVPPPAAALVAGSAPGVAGQKAWEMGRQSYLSWAVGKALANASGAQQKDSAAEGATPAPAAGLPAGEGGLEGVEQSLKGVGTQADLDAAARAL